MREGETLVQAVDPTKGRVHAAIYSEYRTLCGKSLGDLFVFTGGFADYCRERERHHLLNAPPCPACLEAAL